MSDKEIRAAAMRKALVEAATGAHSHTIAAARELDKDCDNTASLKMGPCTPQDDG